MDYILTPIEARIVGVLIEKEMTTPDYYPMTLNALINACNQKSNREPVMKLDETDADGALASLRNCSLVWQVKTQGSRALKYEHNTKEIFSFSNRELAVVCVLLLRGAQTPGELRLRTTRMCEFEELPALERVLEKLEKHEKGPFVVRLPRAPGQKENRFMHLFYETDPAAQIETAADADPNSGPNSGPNSKPDSGPDAESDPGRLEILENQVTQLQSELEQLREAFLEFKKSFE